MLAPHLDGVDEVGRHVHHQGLGLRLQHDALGLVLAPHHAEGHHRAHADDQQRTAAGRRHDRQQHVLVVKLLRLLPGLRLAGLDRRLAAATIVPVMATRLGPAVGLGLDVGGGDVDLVGVPARGIESLEEG